MDFKKAIEVLELRSLAYRKTNFPDRVDAINLGIKALKIVSDLETIIKNINQV